jgi:RNA polymerase sigma-70 factor (ECF subfamily)
MHTEIQTIWKYLYLELNAFIYSKVKDEETGKDILQEIFIKVHLNIHKLKDSSKLTSWVYQITRNVIHDYFRNEKRLVQLDNIELPIAEEPSFQRLSDCINSKIEQLPKVYQEAMVLTTFQNLKQTELADYLGISYSGTKSRVQRAKEKLIDLVANCEHVETDSEGNIIEHNLDD